MATEQATSDAIFKREPTQEPVNIQNVPHHASSSSAGQDAAGAANSARQPPTWLTKYWQSESIKKAFDKIWTQRAGTPAVQSWLSDINKHIINTCAKKGQDPQNFIIPWADIEKRRDFALSTLNKMRNGEFKSDSDGFQEYDQLVADLENALKQHHFPASWGFPEKFGEKHSGKQRPREGNTEPMVISSDDEFDEAFVPEDLDIEGGAESDADNDTGNDARSTGAPEPELHDSIEFGDDSSDDSDSEDDDDDDDDDDDSFKNLALKSAFRWGLPLDGEVVGFLCRGPFHYQILLRQGHEGGYRYRMEAGSGYKFEKTDELDLVKQQRGDVRVSPTREYGKVNARKYEAKDLQNLKGVAWKVSAEYRDCPLELIDPISETLYAKTWCLVEWTDGKRTWETRTTLRRLCGISDGTYKADYLIYHRAQRQERVYDRIQKAAEQQQKLARRSKSAKATRFMSAPVQAASSKAQPDQRARSMPTSFGRSHSKAPQKSSLRAPSIPIRPTIPPEQLQLLQQLQQIQQMQQLPTLGSPYRTASPARQAARSPTRQLSPGLLALYGTPAPEPNRGRKGQKSVMIKEPGKYRGSEPPAMTEKYQQDSLFSLAPEVARLLPYNKEASMANAEVSDKSAYFRNR